MVIEGQNGQLMVIVEKGQNLVETLTSVAKEFKLKGGRISGVGAVEHVELGYYELHEKSYIRKTFSEGDFELISLNGNITLKGGEPYVHVHTSIGDKNFQVYGGHLFEAVVAVTAEVHIFPLGTMPERLPNADIGLDLVCGIRD
ncbi:MAG: DNA-binding protein [Bdellovibrionales bacterium]|nr:DNA-binding protein [Bdellovibrionales bacterium]